VGAANLAAEPLYLRHLPKRASPAFVVRVRQWVRHGRDLKTDLAGAVILGGALRTVASIALGHTAASRAARVVAAVRVDIAGLGAHAADRRPQPIGGAQEPPALAFFGAHGVLAKPPTGGARQPTEPHSQEDDRSQNGDDRPSGDLSPSFEVAFVGRVHDLRQ